MHLISRQINLLWRMAGGSYSLVSKTTCKVDTYSKLWNNLIFEKNERPLCFRKKKNHSQTPFPSSFVAAFATGQPAWQWLPTFFQDLRWSAAWAGGLHSDCRSPRHPEDADTIAGWRPLRDVAALFHNRGTAIQGGTDPWVFMGQSSLRHKIQCFHYNFKL